MILFRNSCWLQWQCLPGSNISSESPNGLRSSGRLADLFWLRFDQINMFRSGFEITKISYRAIVHDFVHGQNIFCTIQVRKKSCYLKFNISLKYLVKGVTIIAQLHQRHQMEPSRAFFSPTKVSVFGKKIGRIYVPWFIGLRNNPFWLSMSKIGPVLNV